MNSYRNCIRLAVLVSGIFLVNPFGGQAQNNTRTPYSMYGLGELRSQQNAVNTAMGGAGMALSSSTFLNTANPASYRGIDSLNVLFDMGVEGKYSQFQSKGITNDLNTANLSYFGIGWRFSPKFAAGFGLNPFSSTGYEINSTASIDGIIGSEYPLNIIGSGDISRAYGSLSYSLSKRLAIGVKTSFLFGSLKQTQYHNLSVIGSSSIYNETTDYFHNFYFEFGAQYDFKLKNYNITLGAIYNPGQDLVTKRTNTTYNSNNTILEDETDNRNDFKIPEEFGLGIAVNNNKNWLYVLDAGIQKWSDFDYDIKSVELKNNPYVRTGLEYTPSTNFMASYFKRTNYRIGFQYAKSYLSLKGTQLDEYSFSVGLGLPIRNQKSRIDVSTEFGTKGTTESQLIQENFVRVRLGFSLKDMWFIQRKYN